MENSPLIPFKLNIRSGAKLVENEKKREFSLSTSISSLDSYLNSGLPMPLFVQIYGEKGSGKTGLCYQLLLDVVQNKNGIGIYVNSDSGLNVTRLSQMAEAASGKINTTQLLQRIHVLEVETLTDLLEFMTNFSTISKDVGNCCPIRLLIIDSLPSLLYPLNAWDKRSKILEFGSRAHELISKYGIGIIVTSSLSTVINDKGQSQDVDSLGETFAPYPNIRLELTKNREWGVEKNSRGPSGGSGKFSITTQGIRDSLVD